MARGESLAVGDGNELAQQLEELLKKEAEKTDPEEDFDFEPLDNYLK